MTEVNKTLYIPLYGKALCSRKGIILNDKKAEEIWGKAGFPLKGKSRSKWLAYYMGMRAAVFDGWVSEKCAREGKALVIHVGCGLDSRAERVGAANAWYDVDFPDVIEERKKYFAESESYKMLGADVRGEEWLSALPAAESAVVIMEGVSMYFSPEDLRALLSRLACRFEKIALLMDCYTVFAAKASKYKNPINDVGVTSVYGIDSGDDAAEGTGLRFICEREMTPTEKKAELRGAEKFIFSHVYGGSLAKKMYRLYEYEKVR
ncbi:MAG: class I SAM-dependent methyltransferase [Clostridia bacterium]|nr:class I SAM-dependent methyltransferase [Clostridia bacterium]